MRSIDKNFYKLIGKEIRIARKNNKKSLQKVADEVSKILNRSVLKQTLSKIELGKIRVDDDLFEVLCDLLDINHQELINYGKQSNKLYRVPVLGKIPAGIPIEAIEDIIDYEDINEDMLKGGKEYFGLKIKGNSMSPKYLDKDTVLFLKIDDCESGDDCAVIVNRSDAVFKRVIKQEKGIMLQSLNPEYESNFYSCEDIEKLPITIIGVAKEIRRKI